MMDSQFNTIAVPQRSLDAGGPQDTGALLIQANKVPLRVLVRNLSALGTEVILALDAATTQVIPLTSNVYVLPAGSSDAFMMAPGQKMYAVSTSAGCRISYAVSEALPED